MIAKNYELLQVIFEHVLNQFSSIQEKSLAVLGKKDLFKILYIYTKKHIFNKLDKK